MGKARSKQQSDQMSLTQHLQLDVQTFMDPLSKKKKKARLLYFGTDQTTVVNFVGADTKEGLSKYLEDK